MLIKQSEHCKRTNPCGKSDGGGGNKINDDLLALAMNLSANRCDNLHRCEKLQSSGDG